MIRYITISILLLCLGLSTLSGQANGNLTQMDDKLILHVWGTHYERGYAQGYYLANRVMDVFQDFYYTMYAFSNPDHYAYLWNWYQQKYSFHPQMYNEAEGLIAGMSAAGVSLYHNGLQRELGTEDVLLANAVVDMLQVRNARGGDDGLQLGCASLSSWGVSTQQDSLLAGSAVITRWLDWTQNSALIANPLLVVHHPAEAGEQKWMNFTFPGMLGALSAINQSGVSAFLNTGNGSNPANPSALTPILFDLRDGIERFDYNLDGSNNVMDTHAAVQAGRHLSGTIIHGVSEALGSVSAIITETHYNGTAFRYYNQGGNLPGNHLAATNHFRMLGSPVCCTRYANIQDSLYTNHHMTAKRQWRVLAGATGLETNLTALQYTPSTGNILWASAATASPAWIEPALTLNRDELFSFSVSNQDDVHPPRPTRLSLSPNPIKPNGMVTVKSTASMRSVSVYNLRGQKAMEMSVPSGKDNATLYLQGLGSGMYLLRVKHSDGGVSTGKIVITK